MFLSTMADLTTTTSTPNQTPTPTTTATTTPETDTETPPPHTKPTNHHHTKILSFTNGALKNHHQNHHHHLSTPSVVIYKECLKNHAASLGGHALDGCGEFMPSQTATATDPTSLKCAACGCHRNFHRREPEEGGGAATQIIEFQANPIPTPPRHRSPTNSVSPPPISSAYYPSSAPHMLLALSGGGLSGPSDNHNRPANTATTMTTTMTTPPVMGSNSNGGGGRKRFRTKFSQEQKEKMYSFSEKVGWKMQKKDEGIMEEFCNEIGIGRSVLKVWMHNNKHTFGKRDGNNSNDHHHHHLQSTNIISPNNNYGTTSHVPNGSSSSS